jgi:hypothetical protein
VVIDQDTGRPAYDALNKWNSTTTGGAVHLVSPPNTLGAEIYLAAAATILREHDGVPVTDPGSLLDCSKYGRAFRNSDPHIGESVNTLVRTTGKRATLTNPVGLYIQDPQFNDRWTLPFSAPPDAKPSDYWRIVRGKPGMGLHAVFEVPPELGFTVGDIMIDGNPIEFGSQIVQFIEIQLKGQIIPSTLPPQKATECQVPNPSPLPSPQSLQAPRLRETQSRSNLAPRVAQGSTVYLDLTAGDMKRDKTVPTVTFSGEGITVHKTAWYAALDDRTAVMKIKVEVAQDAPLGDRALLLTNPDGAHGPSAPGMLEVVAAGSIPAPQQQAQEQAPSGDAQSGSDLALLKPTHRAHRR